MMSEATAKDMIQHALDQDFNKANEVFGEIMSVKISDVLDQEKIKIAGQIYNGDSEDPDPEDDDYEAGDEDDVQQQDDADVEESEDWEEDDTEISDDTETEGEPEEEKEEEVSNS